MIHKEYLDYRGASNYDCVVIKSGPSERLENVRKLGDILPLQDVLSGCADDIDNGYYCFLPGNYSGEELNLFFKSREIKGIKCRGDWIYDYFSFFCEGLEYLSVDNKRVLKLDYGFPSLKRLSANKVRFKSYDLESLKHLSCYYERVSFEEACKCALSTLNIIGCKEDSLINEADNLSNLVFLGVRGGSYANYKEVAKLSSLVGLWLQDIGAYVDVSLLKESLSIKELTVAHCSNVLGLEELAESGRLKAIQIFGCSNLDKEKLLPLLRSNIDQVVLN